MAMGKADLLSQIEHASIWEKSENVANVIGTTDDYCPEKYPSL